MISIVIPVYNEEANLHELFRRTISALSSFTDDFEVICVDDGSTDNSYNILKELHNKDKRFKFISLSRNFGHQRAILAGLSHTKGDFIGVMDGDLQDPPELFEKLYEKIQEGYDVVYAIRKKRKEKWLKRFSYWLFYRFLNAVSETTIPLDSGDFSLISRKVLDIILKMPEQSLFIRGLRSWVGFNQCSIEYERDSRLAGKPKFNIKRMFHLAYSGLFSFSNFPIKFLGVLGLIVVLFSMIYGAIIIIKRICYPEIVPAGFTTLILSILFFSGVQLIALRILGEYILRIYEESRKRPLYVVREKFLDD
ncbi:MAG: glycosyltransferase family 2 protein [Marinilabiliales bacterium]